MDEDAVWGTGVDTGVDAGADAGADADPKLGIFFLVITVDGSDGVTGTSSFFSSTKILLNHSPKPPPRCVERPLR